MARFQYCLNSSTIKPAPILEKIRIAAETGYGAIELWHDDIDAHLQKGGNLAEIRKAVDDRGLVVPTTIMLKGWFDTTGEAHQTALEECKRRLNQAAEVGAEYSICGPPLQSGLNCDQGAKHYRELLELGLSLGVKPAMEYLGFAGQVNTIDDALAIVEKAAHPAGSVVLDPFHCYRGGGGFDAISKLAETQVAISHFNDAPATVPQFEQHDPDRVMPGEGCIDLTAYCNLLSEIGYTRWLSLELFREDLWAQDLVEVARIGLEKMRSVAEA